MGTKKNPDRYDCLKTLKDDEPFFILRGQDRLAPAAIDEWVRRAKINKVPHDKVMAAMMCAEAMRAYPGRKVPD